MLSPVQEAADILKHWDSGPLSPTPIHSQHGSGYHVATACELSLDETNYRTLGFRVEVLARRYPATHPFRPRTATPFHYEVTIMHPIEHSRTPKIVALNKTGVSYPCPLRAVGATDCFICHSHTQTFITDTRALPQLHWTHWHYQQL